MPSFVTHTVHHAVTRLWTWIFKESAPEAMLRHIDRFLAFGVGMLAAKLLSAAAQILVGRVLGPADYGRLTVVLLLAAYFAVPIAGGWGPAFTRIVAQTEAHAPKVAALNALLLISLLSCLLVCGTLLVLRGTLASWLGIEAWLVDATIATTLLYAWWVLARQVAQAFQAWRTYVTVDIVLSVILTLLVLGLLSGGYGRLFPTLVAFWIAYAVAGLMAVRLMFRGARPGAVAAHFKPMFRHGSFMLFSGLVTISTYSIDRIIIQKTLGPAAVGLYQAHFMATFGIISALMAIVLAYLFPLFCQDRDEGLYRRLRRAIWLQYPMTAAVSVMAGLLALWLYGYPLSPPLFVCLVLFGSVQFHVQIKASYLSSKGAGQALVALGSQLTFLVLNAMILLYLVGRLGIVSGGVALLAAALGSLFYLVCSERFSR